MFHVLHTENLDAPELAPYRTMKLQCDHQQQGIFVAEGEKVVRRLLESRLTVLSVLMPAKWICNFEPLLEARPEKITAYAAEKTELEKLTGFSMYQGVLALAKIPEPASLDGILETAARPRLLIAVDALANAENLGALVRNAVAFGVQALIVGETSNSPYLRRAVRSSMGTIFQLPVVESADLAATVRELHQRKIHCVAAHPSATGRTLMQARFTRDCCLVFGSEGHGISARVLETCDEAVAIPMPPTVDSLNVASASAVFLYEVARQRSVV